MLPEAAKEKPRKVKYWRWKRSDRGQRVPLEVKVGDRVIYSKYAGTEVKMDDKEYLILRQSDILAIVE